MYKSADHTIIEFYSNDKKQSGKNSSGNVFYKGDILYSYGYHYKLGAIVEGITFASDRGYSSTTNKHKHTAQWKAKITLPLLDGDFSDIILACYEIIKYSKDKLKRARIERTKNNYNREIVAQTNNIKILNELMKRGINHV